MDLLTWFILATGGGAVVSTAVVMFTVYLFWPYYGAMWKYRRSGQMKAEAHEVVEFVNEWWMR